ncbi:hypothetical protein ACFLUR_01945 [Chloroflexota bacterium]
MNVKTNEAWQDYFFDRDKLASNKHGRVIIPSNLAHDEDSEYFQKLTELSFASHVVIKPENMRIENIGYSSRDATSFYKLDDVTNLFVNSYYDYPNIVSIQEGIEIPVKSEKVFTTLRGQIADPHGIVVLQGEVGEGKSTFLSKLSLDLLNNNTGQKYYPIMIDFHKYSDIIDIEPGANASSEFWRKAGEYIVDRLEDNKQLFIPTTESEIRETQTKGGFDFLASMNAIILRLQGGISRIWSRKYIREKVRAIDLYKQIVRAANELNKKHNTRLVLIFDNLDTLSYDHERHMLSSEGYKNLRTRVACVHDIFWGVIDRTLDSEISFIFTVRPYVYTHVFETKLHVRRRATVNGLYKLGATNLDQPIKARINMLIDLANNLENNKRISRHKQDIVKRNLKPFVDKFKDALSGDNIRPFEKLVPLANQGFRSVVDFYGDLYHHPDLVFNYFRHDVLYLYLLSKKALYSQVPPDRGSPLPISYFPNIFLVICDNYLNERVADAHKPNRLTFWLKYLILEIVQYYQSKNNITISNILKYLDSYDDHAVRLAIGSLSTVNEYNCLSLRFTGNLESLEEIETSTFVSLSNRGRYLVENDYCFSFECLQLFFDDWLLPRPKPEYLGLHNKTIEKFIEPMMHIDEYSYDYMLNANIEEYEKNRRYIIFNKARQALILLITLKHAEEYETSVYPESWNAITNLLGNTKTPFLSDGNYNRMKNKIIGEVSDVMRRDRLFIDELVQFSAQLEAESPQFKQYFDLVEQNTPIKERS